MWYYLDAMDHLKKHVLNRAPSVPLERVPETSSS
jgi:hypothetical protein